MGYEACGEDVDNLLKSLDADKNKDGKISQNTKDLMVKVRSHLKNPK